MLWVVIAGTLIYCSSSIVCRRESSIPAKGFYDYWMLDSIVHHIVGLNQEKIIVLILIEKALSKSGHHLDVDAQEDEVRWSLKQGSAQAA